MKVLKSKINLALVTIFGTTSCCFIFYFFYGTPWDLTLYKNEFDEYLENKYNKDFVIDELSFDFLHGKTYYAYAHPKENPDISFYVGQNSSTRETEDSYHYETWRKQAKEELGPIVKNLFPENTNYVVEIYPIRNLSISEESETYNFKEYATVDIGVSMNDYDITNANRDREIERSYRLLVSLKEKEIKFSHFGISYLNKTIQLQPDEIRSINTPDDLERWLNDYR